MKYQNIYDRSPIFSQNAMATIYGYMVNRQRYGKRYYEYLSFLKQFDCLSRQEQQAYQLDQLVKLLAHAVRNSKFYRDLYAGIDINAIGSIEDIKILPIVTKEQLRENIDLVVAVDKSSACESHTGGTTGKSLIVYFTEDNSCERMATLDHFKMKHGFVNLRMKKATFNGKHIVPPNQRNKVFWRYNAASKQMVFSSFHHNNENIPYYIAALNKFQPAAIDGFVSSIYDIAAFVERHGLRFSFSPVAVFPTSETVTPAHREVIERVFGCPVRDQYASSEGAPFVYECSQGNMHYDLSSGVIETLDDTGEILVTSFTTYGTPLIRYRIGDSMVLDDPSKCCPCGMHTPLITRIDGRVADYLVATNGTKINLGNVANIVKNLPCSIVKMQIIQDEISKLNVKLVVDTDRFVVGHQALVRNEIQYKFGKDMDIAIDLVEDIPCERSGKYRLIVNNVSE
ncbi:MAG: phenylacetate--CoA ligase family protein [Armatimonadota bacterium]